MAPTIEATDGEKGRARTRGLSYARAGGVGLGIVLIGWGIANPYRWGSVTPGFEIWLHLETLFFICYGALLACPWRKIQETAMWKPMFGVLIAFSIAFGFVMVLDTLALHALMAGTGQKPPPPGLQSMQIFIGLLQLPVVLFLKRPELLD